MFGKRRNKDEDHSNEQIHESEGSGSSFGGPFMPSQPTHEEPSQPLYGEKSSSGSHQASPLTDEQFAANLEADLVQPVEEALEPEAAAIETLETDPEPEEQFVAADPASEQPEPQIPAPSAPPERKRISRDGDEMLGLLTTIETQLGELQRLKADRESLIDDLEQARQDIDAQREVLAQRELSVAALEAEAVENQRITESMLTEAERREAELERAKAEFDQQKVTVEELERTLNDRSAELESRDQELRTRLEQLEHSEREASQREQQWRDQISGEYESRLGELQKSLEDARAEVETLQRELGDRVAEIELLQEDAEKRLAEQKSTLEAEFASRIESQQQNIDERVQRLQQELDDARASLENAASERSDIEAKRSESENAVEQLRAQLESAQQAASAGGESAEQLTAAQSRIGELESQLTASRDQLGAMESQLGEAHEHAAAAEKRATEIAAEVEAVQAKLAAAPQQQGVDPAEITKRDRAIELLKSKLDQMSERCKQLDAKLQEAATAPTAAPTTNDPSNTKLDALQQKLLARQQELDVVAHKLDAREKSLKQRESTSGSGKPMAPAAMSGTEEEREALRKESEQLYLQRESLAEAKAAVDRSAKKVAAKAAKGKAVNVVLAAVVTMVILAFASWYVAGEIAKPIHVASVELGIDPQATPTASQLEAWQGYHEALLEDPQFHELAARRLKARGYTQFGTPSDVREMVSSGLIAFESSEDGRLTLLYTGEGSERSQRVLETFSGSLSSFANETRDHRYDSAATAIISPASIDPTPIDDPRMNLFAMLFGGACAAALFSSLVLWRRMSRDISEFDARLGDDIGLPVAVQNESEGGASSEGRRLMF